MNYQRIYKLSKFGIPIPEKARPVFEFIEDILSKIERIKQSCYVDGATYFQILKIAGVDEYVVRCKYGDFWGTLTEEFEMSDEEIRFLLKSMFIEYFGINIIKVDNTLY